MDSSYYRQQLQLLLEVLPYIAEEKTFALKGGTLINLFIQDLPRISVDIDLTYLPLEDRETSHRGIDRALRSITNRLRSVLKLKVQSHTPNYSKYISRLYVASKEASIKIEPNLILRGSVYPSKQYDLVHTAQEQFGEFITITGLSEADIYAGKFCAALDRQHPRDLFDVKILFENGGITDEMRKAFVIYLVSSNRPMDELLRPNLIDISDIFQKEFLGMTSSPIALEELTRARDRLIEYLQNSLSPEERSFIISVAEGAPVWKMIEFSHVRDLPAIRWKLFNVQKMDVQKKNEAIRRLREVLEI